MGNQKEKKPLEIFVNDDFDTEIYTTYNYDQFHLIERNRPIEDSRKNKILNSVKKVGWQPTPIMVDGNMGIIDGQGRWAVATEHNLPLRYYIVHNAGIKECGAINASTSSWKEENWVVYHAEGGNENFQIVRNLKTQFDFAELSNIIMATTGKESAHGAITDGTLRITEEFKNEAIRLLTFSKEVYDSVVAFGGDGVSSKFFNAAMFAYQCDGHDRDYLVEVCGKYSDFIDRFRNTSDMLRDLTTRYNDNIGRRRIKNMFFEMQYITSYGKPGSWYSNKWEHYPKPEEKEFSDLDDGQASFDF